MIKDKILEALQNQIESEASSSQTYLAMGSWAEAQGLEGIAEFMYGHSDEERMHMIKLVHYVNERGAHARIPSVDAPRQEFNHVREIFEQLLKHETKVSEQINNLVALALELKDFPTFNFLQWYVAEQIEEELLAQTALDKLNIIGDDKAGLYMFDRDIINLKVTSASEMGEAEA